MAEMNKSARLILGTSCAAFILLVVDQILLPWFGRTPSESLEALTKEIFIFLGGALAKTAVDAIAGTKDAGELAKATAEKLAADAASKAVEGALDKLKL